MNKKKLLPVAMAGIIISLVITAFMPLAVAKVTNFEITPADKTVDATSAYNIQINTTGLRSLNITIPAGFRAIKPTESGKEIVRAHLWDVQGRNWTIILESSGDGKNVKAYGYNITGVRSDDVYFNMDYSPGGGINVASPWGGGSYANLTLPTATSSGSLNISALNLTNATIIIGEFVKNPTTPGKYKFSAEGVPEILHIKRAPPEVTTFEVTPADNTAGATSAYTIQINTTGFTSLNTTLPAGFKAKTPSSGDLIARADLWWNTPTPGTHYGYITFTANASDPSNKVDVFANIGGATASLTEDVDYSEGATTSIKSPFGAQEERASLTLPTATTTGSLNIHNLPDTITNVTVSVGEYVKNPTTPGKYKFSAEGVPEILHIERAPPPPPAGVPPAPPPKPPGVTSIPVAPTGEVTSSVTPSSPDGKATVKVPAGIIAKDAAGNPLEQVEIKPPAKTPAAAPPKTEPINYKYAYDFGPTGATFSEPVTVSITFDPADIPEGYKPVIHTYEADEWKALPTDIVDNTAKTTVTHFSVFALFAEKKVVVPPVKKVPALELTDLTLSPESIKTGENTTISATVTNTGNASGTNTTNITVDGKLIHSENVTLAPDESTDVTCTYTGTEKGNFTVTAEVDGVTKTKTLTVKPKPAPGFLAVLAIASLLVTAYMLLRKRR